MSSVPNNPGSNPSKMTRYFGVTSYTVIFVKAINVVVHISTKSKAFFSKDEAYNLCLRK